MRLSEHTALEIIDRAASHFAVHYAFADDLRGELRTDTASLRRAEVMYVLWRFGMGYSEIGRMFSRDHTTVRSACQRIEERLRTHVGYREQLEVLLDLARGVVVLTQKRERMGQRERLADERAGYTHKVEITAARHGEDPNAPSEIYAIDVYIQVSEFPDGRLAELFLKIGKQGDIHAVCDLWARNTSIGLQNGIDVETLFKACVGTSFEPSGPTSNRDIPRCTSIPDYVGRWILARYGTSEGAR